MKFNRHQAIYLQIGDLICEGILEGRWAVDEKLPSVREMAMAVEVNPNTVMRTDSDTMVKSVTRSLKSAAVAALTVYHYELNVADF